MLFSGGDLSEAIVTLIIHSATDGSMLSFGETMEGMKCKTNTCS